MSGFWRDVWITARHELRDALRSKRALVMLVLYLGGALIATNFFIEFLKRIEDTLMNSLGAGGMDSVGKVAQRITDTDLWRKMLQRITDNKELGLHLAGKSPLALYYWFFSFSWAPILMAIIASTRVSDEVAIGASRFVLYRTSLSAWVIGKYLGQAMLLVPALLCSAAGAWIIGWFRLDAFEPAAAARDLLMYSGLVWFYVMAYLGMAVGASTLTRSSVLATVYALLGVMLTSTINGLALFFSNRDKISETGKGIWQGVRLLVPQGHRSDLLWGDFAHVIPAMFALLVLSLFYLLPGIWRMSRRDT